MDPLRPYDIFNLISGAARSVIADADGTDAAAVPENLADIVALIQTGGAYAPATDWRDLGAAVEGNGASYSHGHETEGQNIEQESGALFEEVSQVNRGASFNMAELYPENASFLENATAIETIAAVADASSAQKAVGLGSYSDLVNYRFALIGYRKRQAGLVIEPSGIARPRLVAVALNRVTLAGDEREFTWEKGNLVNGDISLEAFPEPGEPKDVAYGRWFFEDAGTIPETP